MALGVERAHRRLTGAGFLDLAFASGARLGRLGLALALGLLFQLKRVAGVICLGFFVYSG
jgi:hypothetical protein